MKVKLGGDWLLYQFPLQIQVIFFSLHWTGKDKGIYQVTQQGPHQEEHYKGITNMLAASKFCPWYALKDINIGKLQLLTDTFNHIQSSSYT